MTTNLNSENAEPSGKKPSRFNESDYLTIAWVSVFAAPVWWLVGFAAAHLPYLIWPYEEGAGLEPWWFALICVALILTVIGLGSYLAWHFGNRAVAGGKPSGKWAAWLGVAFFAANCLMFLVQTVVTLAGWGN